MVLDRAHEHVSEFGTKGSRPGLKLPNWKRPERGHIREDLQTQAPRHKATICTSYVCSRNNILPGLESYWTIINVTGKVAMDYHSIHGQDISSFDLTSTPAQALEDISTDPRRYISTGIRALDNALVGGPSDDGDASPGIGGFQRGQVIEIWGPPGSGKTALGMQLAVNALKTGGKVIWVDGFHTAWGQRLQDMISRGRGSPSVTDQHPEAGDTDNLLHFTTPCLAHLIALLCKPTTGTVPDGPGPSARRLQVLQFLISALQKLAATRDILIIILSQCATRMQAEHGATLVPAINANAWEQGIAGRLVLFKDWTIRNGRLESARFTGIQKLDGRLLPGIIGPAFAFDIQSVSCHFIPPQIKPVNLIRKDAVVGIETDSSQPSLVLSTSHSKRKLDKTDFELADSEDEDYDWDDEDAIEMPTVPQWQGSEDILLGHKEDDGNQSETTSDDRPQDPDVSP
ncbi:hypothetical protein DL771_012325 [Monosporascus sp. 5C6A]|nr:hypothetical protein DL771_012325 [Monosporascus sp. 5C6A]